MRNPVARHDFNRASTHEDHKKSWQPTFEEGFSEWEEELIEKSNPPIVQKDHLEDLSSFMNKEYLRGVKSSGVC